MEVDIPAINESFYGNFYAREDAQLNFGEVAGKNNAVYKLNSDGKNLLEEVRSLGRAIDDNDDYEKLQQAGEVASTAISANQSDNDPEELKHIEEDLQTTKKILADIRERNRENIRREDLDGFREYYKSNIKKFAKPQEITQLENLMNRAEMLIEREDSAFEDTMDEIRDLSYSIVIRDDEFIVYCFNSLMKTPGDFDDKAKFYQLAGLGRKAIAQKDYVTLRKVLGALYSIGRRKGDELLAANILKA